MKRVIDNFDEVDSEALYSSNYEPTKPIKKYESLLKGSQKISSEFEEVSNIKSSIGGGKTQ